MPDESTRGDESQASQLLRAVLPPLIGVALESKDSSDKKRFESDIVVAEASLDCGSRATQIQYHLHGLAVTQTDSQTDDPDGKSSQKENVTASSNNNPHSASLPVPSSPPTRPLINSSKIAEEISHQNHVAHPCIRTPIAPGVKPAKGVSFVSPVPSPHTTPQRRGNTARASCAPTKGTYRPLRHKSPRPASQDSFAGPLPPEDAQKVFLRQTKAFNVPLSELGRLDAALDDSPSIDTSISDNSNMHSYSPQLRRVPPPTPARPDGGREFFVAGTPSDSSCAGGSQQQTSNEASHSQGANSCPLGGDTQISDVFLMAQGQPRDDFDMNVGDPLLRQDTSIITMAMASSPPDDVSTQPSSSYERLLNANPFEPIPELTQPATQPDAAMQPTSQSADHPTVQSTGPSLVPESRHDKMSSLNFVARQYAVDPSIATTTTVTIPKGLAGIISSHRRGRYGLSPRDNAQDVTRDFTGDVGEQQTCPTQEETQPSEDVVPETLVSVPRRTLPPPPRRQLPPRVNDGKDVDMVPGSEPMEQPEPPTTSPAIRPQWNAPPAIRPPPSEGEVIPDSAVTEEERSTPEQTEEEAEIPLAVVAKATTGRRGAGAGRGKAIPAAKASPTEDPRLKPAAPRRGTRPATLRANGQDRDALKAKVGKPREPSIGTSVVPSSRPHQDVEGPVKAVGTRSRGAKAGKDRATPAPATRKASIRVKSRSNTPPVVAMTRKLSMKDEPSSDDETAISKEATPPDLDQEAATELADDDHMDVDEGDELLIASSRSRKRKRVASTSRGPGSKASTTSNKTASTPQVRPGKKIKVSGSALRNHDLHSATRVFALWKSDGHYYSGTVHSLVSAARCQIKFDDDTTDTVDISKLRLCRFNVGDQVLVLVQDKQRIKAKVLDATDIETERRVKVEFDDGDEVHEESVELHEICIASRTILSNWKDRTVAANDITPIVRPIDATPSPSKLTIGSTSSVAGRKLLAKTGLVVTMSPGNGNWSRDKDRLMSSIKKSGGTVIEDWTDIFAMDGTHSQNGKRWVIHRKDVTFKRRDDIERVFLLSDDANQKPKFLIALALGIPCLSIEWLERSLDQRTELDWQQHLLPAGFIESLEIRVSQLVDLDWGNCIEYLKDIMENNAAPKIFKKTSILCVASEFVPLPTKGRRNNNEESSRTVPRIILAMGADRVEAVPDIKFASADPKQFDYVLVHKSEDVARIPSDSRQNCVTLAWVKECLIAQRILERAP